LENLVAQNVGDGKNVKHVDAKLIELLADDSNCARPTHAVPVFRW
jgi:hypothetical protein